MQPNGELNHDELGFGEISGIKLQSVGRHA